MVVARQRALLETDLADAYLITSDPNLLYMTGFSGGDSEALILPKKTVLFTDERYIEQAERETTPEAVLEIDVTDRKGRARAIARCLRGSRVTRLGVEQQHMNVAVFAQLSKVSPVNDLIDVSDQLLKMREIKSDLELKYIRTACKATDEVMAVMADYICAGMSEYEILAKLLYEICIREMQPAFPPIVAAARNGVMPHANVSRYRVRQGDFLTMDFGCRFRGYCSDMTRTLAIGAVDGEMKTIYDIVQQAQAAAEAEAVIGAIAQDIDAAARDWIEVCGYGDCFHHSTGHGVGLEVHELPLINRDSKTVIRHGMVFTVEPGLYVPYVGGVRIEDTYAAGTGSLFSFPKYLIEL